MAISQSQLKINIPGEVKQWLAAEAERNLRSQTAEIILALKEKMHRQAKTEKADAAA